ncbi:glycosyltransferase involved in cell wall biosynthesis [Luteibacter sp. Sphag1AF]|uniref:glycosyltransferase family 4 protein n=1 Tax=Luteibacter sp. Sphag1AF TaxID=2587031 RepID=UPI00161C3BA2|nr:glycosyltransferase family 4 protein [Luteibacter sp. Sphag1AF]MBB3227793.1 glycosyltransferase involved in cell wall biosynthesis [Luteibacter sp. Sphag1AF]
MRLLFVGSSRGGGGAEKHMVALATAMAEAGHSVGAAVDPLSLMASEFVATDVRMYPAALRNVLDIRGYAAIVRAMRDLRPDVLVSNFGKEYWPLILLGWLYGVRVALFRHRVRPMKPLSRRLVPWLADYFFVVSEYARRRAVDEGIPSARVRVLYNPMDVRALGKTCPRQRHKLLNELGLDEHAIVVGYVGRLHEGKGVYVLLDALREAMAAEPRLHCVWLGSGIDTPRLTASIAADSFAARHHMLGWVNDPSPYYHVFSMLAFPSTEPETFGRSSAEAQAAGVPVLASELGGLPETLVPGVTGLLLPPDDAAAWRDAILAMCDPGRRAPMAEAARPFVQRSFSNALIAAEFAHVLRR